MPQIKTSIFGILFFSCTIHLWCQVSFFGDLYIGENKEFHIAFSETYFSGGKIKTHREEPSGVVSFGSVSGLNLTKIRMLMAKYVFTIMGFSLFQLEIQIGLAP